MGYITSRLTIRLSPIRNCQGIEKFISVLLSELAIESPENITLNKYTIEFIEGKQSPYRPIYSLSQVNLEILKMYIQIHLNTKYIQPSKSQYKLPFYFIKILIVDYNSVSIIET